MSGFYIKGRDPGLATICCLSIKHCWTCTLLLRFQRPCIGPAPAVAPSSSLCIFELLPLRSHLSLCHPHYPAPASPRRSSRPAMPSYFRSLFGGGSSSKSNSRSNSTTAPIYATPSAAGSKAGLANPQMQRSYSHATRSTTPSPLRYGTSSDTRTVYGYGRRPTAARPTAEPRPHAVRRASYKTPETRTCCRLPSCDLSMGMRVLIYAVILDAARSALYTPSMQYATPPSSRSNSSSSLYPGAPGVPRSSSSDAVHYGHSRPPLRQNHTWHPTGTAGSSSSYGSRGRTSSQSSLYQQTRSTTLHMHPLLAYTRLHRAPIMYDVSFTPSARTVLDRATRSAIPAHTLSEPATDPPTPAGARLVLHSHKFPWPVVVMASHHSSPASSGSSSRRARFTVGPPSSSSRRPSTSGSDSGHGTTGSSITNLDVLYAVHTTLMVPITPEEWEALGHGSKAQQKVTRAYESRCTRMGGGWEGGVRRIDWLGEKTWLIGVEVDKAAGYGGAGKLVFGKP
ncbi:hypothetical protein BD414DRAFT_175399 [Trametes punicea]|nr:hypothetical protein BD414DRAFT_175399 [Trametes punicea]